MIEEAVRGCWEVFSQGFGESFSLLGALLMASWLFFLVREARPERIPSDEERMRLLGITPRDLREIEEALCARR